MLNRGLSRHTVPAGRFGGFGARGSTSMKTPVPVRQIASASAVVRTRAPLRVAGTRRAILVGAIPVGLRHALLRENLACEREGRNDHPR